MKLVTYLKNKLNPGAQFSSEEEQKRIQYLMAADSCLFANRLLIFLAILEVCIFVVWLIYGLSTGKHDFIILIPHGVFLVVTLLTKHVFYEIKRNIKSRYTLFQWATICYVAFLVIWADAVTYMDTLRTGEFSIMIFFTVLMIIPMAFYLAPQHYLLIVLIGSVNNVATILCCTDDNQIMVLMNFLLCVFISIISSTVFTRVRFKNVKQMILLEDISEKDIISGLYNRMNMEQKLENIWEECKKKESPISCMFCDIDNYKELCDSFGHTFGDECVIKIADSIRENLENDSFYAFRYQSEEFLIVMPDTNYAAACFWTEKLRDRIKAKQNLKHPMILNYGVFTGRPFEDSSRMGSYIVQANELRFQAKKQGPNCIISKDDTVDQM